MSGVAKDTIRRAEDQLTGTIRAATERKLMAALDAAHTSPELSPAAAEMLRMWNGADPQQRDWILATVRMALRFVRAHDGSAAALA